MVVGRLFRRNFIFLPNIVINFLNREIFRNPCGEKSILDISKMSKMAYPPTGVGRISATVPLVNYFLST